MAQALARAVQSGREARAWLLEHGKQDKDAAGGASVNFMMLMGFICGGWIMGMSVLKASQLLASGSGDSAFLKSKQITARFYFDHLLPRTTGYLEMIKAGSDSMMALEENQF
jgi:hypothetical protein